MAKEYIDKEAFIAFIYRGHLRAPWEPCFTENDVVEMVKAFPAADVRENVEGEWIQHYVGDGNFPWGSDCSICGEWLVIDRLVMQEKYHYCPNCGAKMGGAEDG
jgi:hypothetical protein